jgi:hypothetical protein
MEIKIYKLLPACTNRVMTQTTNLQHSLESTAVDARYGGLSVSLVLEYLNNNTVTVVCNTTTAREPYRMTELVAIPLPI